jgi:hypothetical protein
MLRIVMLCLAHKIPDRLEKAELRINYIQT